MAKAFAISSTFPIDRHPKWDERFLQLARLVSTWSKDPSTKVGAVLVSPDRLDVIIGYNGFPQRMADVPTYLNDRETKYSRMVHGEMNALLNARRSVVGYRLYTYPFMCCDRCTPHVIQAGISALITYEATPAAMLRWDKSFTLSRLYFQEAGIPVIEYPTPAEVNP